MARAHSPRKRQVTVAMDGIPPNQHGFGCEDDEAVAGCQWNATLLAAFRRSRNPPDVLIRRGVVDTHLQSAPHTLEGEFELGGQEHFYLETQAAWAQRGEDGSVFVCSSTQHPSEVQAVVAHVLKVPINKVVVQSPRMGGGFGGKETQAALPAALAALAATEMAAMGEKAATALCQPVTEVMQLLETIRLLPETMV